MALFDRSASLRFDYTQAELEEIRRKRLPTRHRESVAAQASNLKTYLSAASAVLLSVFVGSAAALAVATDNLGTAARWILVGCAFGAALLFFGIGRVLLLAFRYHHLERGRLSRRTARPQFRWNGRVQFAKGCYWYVDDFERANLDHETLYDVYYVHRFLVYLEEANNH